MKIGLQWFGVQDFNSQSGFFLMCLHMSWGTITETSIKYHSAVLALCRMRSGWLNYMRDV